MFSEELLLVQSVVDQVDAIQVGADLRLQEFLLHIRTIVSPFIGAVRVKWGLKEEAQVLERAKGKVLMAITFAAIQAKFPRFDPLMEQIIERFVSAKENEDIINTLDALHLLPFVMRTIDDCVDERVKGIVEQVAASSSGVSGIFPAIQNATSSTVSSQFTSLSIHQQMTDHIEAKTRLYYLENRFMSLFELMAMLPDSEPAFHELSIVLGNTPCDLKDLLRWSMESCRSKLLSPAIPTDTIVGQFVHGARMFKLLDPTGLLLDRTSAMARDYLLERRSGSEVHDSVFKMLSVLLEAMPPNTSTSTSSADQKPTISFDVKHEEYLAYHHQPDLLDDDWLPDPPAAGKTPIRHSAKSCHPLAILANFSDPTTLFHCLHHSVMKQLVSGQLAHGKILKRISLFADALFGRALCGRLLVMLHDAQESRMLGGKVKMEIENCAPLIISKLYWPDPEGPGLAHVDLEGFPDMTRFNQQYTLAKPRRHLIWMPALSSVDVDLKIDEITYALNGVPYFAYMFMQRLLQSTKIAHQELSGHEKEGAMYWVERGFCQLQADNTLSLSKPTLPTCDTVSLRAHLFDTDSQPSKPPKPQSDTIPPHNITMVTAMLTNLGPMPAARIHAMLVAMSGLRGVEVGELTGWLMGRPEVQYDPVTGVFCRQTK